MSEEQLRALYGEAMRARPAGAPACPSPEMLLALVRREGPEPIRLATLDHVMSCRECQAEFELLRAIEQSGGEHGSRLAVTRSGRRWYVPVALAASLLLAVVIGREMTAPAAPDISRGTPDAVTLLEPAVAASAGQPLVFAWHPVPGASGYVLEVLSLGGSVALSAETSDTMLVSSDASQLPAGEYRWWVRAAVPGAAVVRSPLRPLKLGTD